MSAQLGTNYLGLPLSGPLIASSSPATGNIDSLLALQEAGAAAVVLPSLFEEDVLAEEALLDRQLDAGGDFAEFAGGALPELPQPDLGSGYFRNLLAEAKSQLDIPVIASLNATKPGSWQRYAEELADSGADALELNLYSVSADPTKSAAEVELAHLAAIEAVKIAVEVPLAVKISPFYSAISGFAARAVDAGADALVLFNRFYAPDLDLKHLHLEAKVELSQPDDQRIVLRWIGILRGQLPSTDLVATSGVASGAEVIKALLVGANVAATASAVLRHGPGVITGMLTEVADWLDEHGYESVDQLRGAMSLSAVENAEAYERAQYQKSLHSGRHLG